MNPRICDICKGLCKSVLSAHKPSSSEWYCEKCYKSYAMTPTEIKQVEMIVSKKGK